ncbi:MAG: PSD1 and planctomycete cytochrome C domain-containing protein [Fuerstiella sp.]|nr:PSD1 and planctomycete cytochrome C domain-containing protein [Fuerstiella sp.]
MIRKNLILICLLILSPAGTSAEVTHSGVDFSRDILPLLSDNCFKCHGPDEANRQAELRLDKHESAVTALASGLTAVVPGNSGDSELFVRVSSDDPDLKMPPPDSGKKLSETQIGLIKEWIDGGAEWSGHWAFQTPKKPNIMPVTENRQTNNAIDNFIHAKLKTIGLASEHRASKETLIRRVTLDLTGLPATIQDVDQFLADESDKAFERVVDRLLDSEQYGEHMARIWLDAARYGDTHGLHFDNERSIWPYRDWVIRSFNDNQPFDQFTIEQIAGDLLPGPTVSQRVATGFNRCNVTTSEGGSIDDEYYVRYAVDRVETTSTVWLGLTAGCAACHDHKFDPITQKEFYQLFSYFFSLTERAMDGNALLPPPIVKVPTAKQQKHQKQYREELAAAGSQIDTLLAKINYADPKPTEPLGALTEEEFVWVDDEIPAGAKPAGDTPWQFVEAPDHPVHSGKKSAVRTGRSNEITQHLFTDPTEKLKLPGQTKLFAWAYLDPENPPLTLQLQFNDGTWEHRATWGADKAHGAGKNDASNRHMGELPETGKWVRLEVSAEAVGLVFGSELNGWAFTQVGGTVHWDTAGIVHPSLSAEQKRSLYAWEQFRTKTNHTRLPDEIQQVLDIDNAERTPEQTEQLTHYYLKYVNPDSRIQLDAPLKRQTNLETKLDDLENAIPATLVMEDRLEPRQAHVLERGQYTEKRQPVSSTVPVWLAPPVENAPSNRLGLAQWLVQPQHPLTSRVTVNRFWQQFFGTGLVKTSEDFGVQGEHPSHPKLLDWLAVDFIESGWDVKRMLKQIVMSATYQQASHVSPEKLAADPKNRFLARGPRFRLDAEVIRDQALAVSGLLTETIGGRSVKPYQPAGLWKPVGFGGSNTATFVQDKGEKLFRRSMYTFWKRTVPPPSMATFDAPDRETCQVRRARTNTPLQALVLMNDVQYVEAARKFAERVMTESDSSVDERAVFAFRSVLNRRPNVAEQGSLTRLFHQSLTQFRNDSKAAEKLLSAGESPRNEQLDPDELAAWSMVTHLLLNLSETVTKE